jgi:hypothetical protein
MNLVLEIQLRRVMGIDLLQLQIFTMQTLRGDGIQQNLAFQEHPVADCKR